jgi:hypothetical protein
MNQIPVIGRLRFPAVFPKGKILPDVSLRSWAGLADDSDVMARTKIPVLPKIQPHYPGGGQINLVTLIPAHAEGIIALIIYIKSVMIQQIIGNFTR